MAGQNVEFELIDFPQNLRKFEEDTKRFKH